MFRNASVAVDRKSKLVRESKRMDAKRLRDEWMTQSTCSPKLQKTGNCGQTRGRFTTNANNSKCDITSLPDDVVNIVLGFAVKDAIANPSVERAEQSIRALAGVSRVFRDKVASQSINLVKTAMSAIDSFVWYGDVGKICKLLDVSDPADAPAAMRAYVYRQFQCSPYTFKGIQVGNVLDEELDGLFHMRKQSSLSSEICQARCASPVLASSDHATERIKGLINRMEGYADRMERYTSFTQIGVPLGEMPLEA
jgi:hypothetical protein